MIAPDLRQDIGDLYKVVRAVPLNQLSGDNIAQKRLLITACPDDFPGDQIPRNDAAELVPSLVTEKTLSLCERGALTLPLAAAYRVALINRNPIFKSVFGRVTRTPTVTPALRTKIELF